MYIISSLFDKYLFYFRHLMENSSHSKMGKKGCTMTGGVTISIIVLLFVIGIPMMAAGVALLNVTR